MKTFNAGQPTCVGLLSLFTVKAAPYASLLLY
jgi:hypothetical protein